jgi:cobalt-zinc-cadmium efflux system membrane fusion protein
MKYFFIIPIALLMSACRQGAPAVDAAGEVSDKGPAQNMVKLSEAKMKNAGIVIGKSERKEIDGLLKLTGSIDVPPQNMVSISVPLGGYLRSTGLLAGMHVVKGESIAIMEDQQYIQLQQDYLTAKARLLLAEQEYNRQSALNQTKASSDKVLQQAQAELTTQKILVKALAEKLRLTDIDPDRLNESNLSRSIRISSPIDGFVSKVNVNIGKYVNPSDVLFEIVNPDDIHLALSVFEKDLDKLSIGQKLIAYTNNDPQRQYPCEIILIGKDFSKDRNVEVHCHFLRYDKRLIPGLFMNAEVRVKSNQVDALPSDAIVAYQGKQYVFIAREKNVFDMVEVKTGDTQDGYTAVTGGNELGTQAVVVKGAYTLLMELKNRGSEEE